VLICGGEVDLPEAVVIDLYPGDKVRLVVVVLFQASGVCQVESRCVSSW
jgi:hypothetical protein